MTLIAASGLAVIFGSETLIENVTFTVMAGDRWGVVGRNGSGKTTLMELITGARQPDKGGVARAQGLRIAVMDQYRDFGNDLTVWDAAARGFAQRHCRLPCPRRMPRAARRKSGRDLRRSMISRPPCRALAI